MAPVTNMYDFFSTETALLLFTSRKQTEKNPGNINLHNFVKL